MKVALYMRVSTDHQTTENQYRRLEEFCDRKGWEVIGHYEDIMTGRKVKRPGLERLLNDAHQGYFQKVISVKVDRVARSLKDLLTIAEQLHRSDIDLIFTDQDMDLSTSSGKMVMQILGAMAEFESELISERTKAGLKTARANGKKLGRKKINGMTTQKVIDLRKEGWSYSVIQKETGLSKGKISQILAVHKRDREKKGVSLTENDTVQEREVI